MSDTWKYFIDLERNKPYYLQLKQFVDQEYEQETIYPPKEKIYNAFKMTPYADVKVVILGQEPYHGPHQAHGLSFSIASPEAKFAPSLRNMFKELESDLGISRTEKNLTDWTQQGILLMNTVLTVRAGQAASHRKQGWEVFTDTMIQHLNQKNEQIIFVLWGADARRKKALITNPVHKIIESVHPSPLSAHNGFFGSKPFSQINQYLMDAGKDVIHW